MKLKFPNYRQTESKDCGPSCVKIISKYFGKTISIERLRNLSENTREGSNLLTLSDCLEKIGFKTIGVKISTERLNDAPLPCIIYWNQNHYVVLYKIKKERYFISDPAHGLIDYSKKEFIKSWIGNNADQTTEEGIGLLLEPTSKFYQTEDNKEENKN